jgi:hypothetical protein
LHDINETSSVDAIEDYNPSKRVEATNARTDRLGVGMDLGFIEFDSTDDAQAFWFYLGAPPKEHRGTEAAGLFGKLFKATPFGGKRRHALKIRKRAIDYDTPEAKLLPPLCSAGRFACRWEISNGKIICHLSFASWAPLKLNPSRALNHRAPELTALEPSPWEQCIFSKQPDLIETGLDGNDNIVPDGVSQIKYRMATKRYLQCVVEAMLDEINRAYKTATDTPDFQQGSEGSGSPFRCAHIRLNEAPVYELETYWEMRVPSATAFIAKHKQALLAFGHEARGTGVTGYSDAESIVGNSSTLLIRLGKGETVRIYAKTADRVRFEVIHTPIPLLSTAPHLASPFLRFFCACVLRPMTCDLFLFPNLRSLALLLLNPSRPLCLPLPRPVAYAPASGRQWSNPLPPANQSLKKWLPATREIPKPFFCATTIKAGRRRQLKLPSWEGGFLG